ncbi:transcription termination factor Rho [Nanchangia anserum]|uniref:Transcription termination factor Rho n=1 Tax=Nanchangia anserum TaxID=2692125 RepID=A0A8I0KS43_9ACTO|nr:transcription termination factor Rho [Nanchangia anserum]MBD3690037.1 transcription termination factor Rho [Nanchangia anserum]QOX82167.1 transcription termination factor Rho [Nanchangia anserum]
MTAHHQSELATMRVGELKALAASLGIRGTSRMRKGELAAVIAAAEATGAKPRPARAAATASPEETPSPAAERAAAHDQSENRDQAEESADAQSGQRRRRSPRQGEGERESGAVLDVKAALAEEHTDAPAASSGAQSLDEIELPDGDERAGRRERRRGRDDAGSRRGRRGRGRRDRNERTDRGERTGEGRDRGEQRSAREDDEVLVPIGGVLDVESNHAFVRTSGFNPGQNDVYVTLGQVRRWGMRAGDAVVGYVRPQGDQPNNRRQKYNALVRVESISGMSVEEARERPHFKDLVPLYPNEQLRLETAPRPLAPRVIDMLAPIGKGQRGLIVSPPKAGKTIILQQIARAIHQNNPECKILVVLVDERPEEVTDMTRTVEGEIIASTFDRPASDHTRVAELAIERAKRLVELGHDVVVLLDSITRLGRAYNLAAPASGRILSGGVDASALYPPKRFFGAARNVENGGSLTILATALVETGSKMDEVIFEEFKGTGNMELRLSRQLADKRLFPAVDMDASSTRREELLLTKEELAIVWKLRRMLSALDTQQAAEFVLSKLKETQSNAEFLMMLSKMGSMRD